MVLENDLYILHPAPIDHIPVDPPPKYKYNAEKSSALCAPEESPIQHSGMDMTVASLLFSSPFRALRGTIPSFRGTLDEPDEPADPESYILFVNASMCFEIVI